MLGMSNVQKYFSREKRLKKERKKHKIKTAEFTPLVLSFTQNYIRLCK